MSRVSRETLDKLQAFFDTLEPEVMSKCALCNKTLTHIVKQAEVQTGAGTLTVARGIAERVNKDSAPEDRINDTSLMQRVVNEEKGRPDKSILRNPQNNNIITSHPEPTQPETQQPEPQQQTKSQTKREAIQKPQKPKREKSDDRVTENFKNAFEIMNDAIQTERVAGWSGMTRITALLYANALINLIKVGEE